MAAGHKASSYEFEDETYTWTSANQLGRQIIASRILREGGGRVWMPRLNLWLACWIHHCNKNDNHQYETHSASSATRVSPERAVVSNVEKEARVLGPGLVQVAAARSGRLPHPWEGHRLRVAKRGQHHVRAAVNRELIGGGHSRASGGRHNQIRGLGDQRGEQNRLLRNQAPRSVGLDCTRITDALAGTKEAKG